MKKLLTILLATICLFALCACNSGSNQDSNKGSNLKVGVVQTTQHPALDAATQGFVDALKENGITDVDVQNASGESANCSTIVGNFVADGVDLIMANATPALQAASAATDTIPVLGTSITVYDVVLGGSVPKNVSGTTDLAPLDEQASMIKELFPDAKKVGILFCSAEPNSQYQVDKISKFLNEDGIETVNYVFNDSNDITAVTEKAVNDKVDVIYIPTDNTAASNTQAIANVVLPAGIPVFTGEEGPCAGCGVATLTISYYDIGFKTGEMAADILLNGADISTMEIESAPQFVKKFNKTNAEKLGITIPEDYIAIEE
mgnify:FL=1